MSYESQNYLSSGKIEVMGAANLPSCPQIKKKKKDVSVVPTEPINVLQGSLTSNPFFWKKD